MGKRTGRKRGAPPGNKNNLRHGGYSAAAVAARKEARIFIEETMLLAAWTNVLGRLQKAKRAGVDLSKLGFSFADD